MPYRIRKDGAMWAVQRKKAGKWSTLTKHATKVKARKHLAALKTNTGH